MILQIRATSGGGKTTLMRYLMALAYSKPMEQIATKRGLKTLINEGSWLGMPFYVIGPYDTDGTGGCDRISEIAQVIALVDQVAKPSHAPTGKDHKAIIAFEGLLLSHSWGQMGEHLHDHYGDRYVNGFIDTSVDQCIANVLKRRKDNSDERRIEKIKQNVINDHYRVELARKRVPARGGIAFDIPYSNAGPFTRDYITNWVEGQRVLYG
jgi:hypothetical protein